MECALRSHDVERAANNRAVGAQPAPLVERFLTSLCGEWRSEPSRPQSLCALADECRAPRNAVATATGEGACFEWSCPRATRARSRRYVLRIPCLWHVLQPQTEVRIARSGCRRRGACHMPLPGEGTTRIKRDQSLSSNPTSRSISIQWAMVHFGGMGSPNIYSQPALSSSIIFIPTRDAPYSLRPWGLASVRDESTLQSQTQSSSMETQSHAARRQRAIPTQTNRSHHR